MSDLRTGLVEAMAQGIYEESVCNYANQFPLWTDISEEARVQWMAKGERALDRGLGFLTDNADQWFDAWTKWLDPVDGDPKFIGLIAVLSDSRDTGEKP